VAKWGFTYLLVFVFGTIIASIAAKIRYGEVLSNVDYLHGTAESALGVVSNEGAE